MQCKHVKPDGVQCNANAMHGSDFCYLHNPAIPDEQKRNSQAKGGEMRSQRINKPLPKIKIKVPEDVIILLADTINRVRRGEMDVKTANCLGALSGQMIRAMDLVDIAPEQDHEASLREKARRWIEFFGLNMEINDGNIKEPFYTPAPIT